MTYTKRQFALDLKQQIRHGFDIPKLSQWAYLLSIDRHEEIGSSLDRIIQQIAVMNEGPEFEFSENELLDLANKIIEEG